MQEIFDEKKISINKRKQTDFILLNEVEKIIEERRGDVEFIYNIRPKSVFTINSLTLPSAKYDCIIAPMLLHKVNDINLFLQKIKESMNGEGIFYGNFFGLNNLKGLGEFFAKEDIAYCKQPLQRILPLIDIKTIGTMLQKNGFKNVVVESVMLNFEFENLQQALKFLKENGESNCFALRNNNFLAGNILKKILAKYTENVTLEFDICFFACLT